MSEIFPWEKKLNTFKVEEIQENKEPLVQFHTFVENSNYLGCPPRTKFMYDEMYKVIGEDPYSIYDKKRIVKEYVGLWGKGGGKTTLAFYLELYIVYTLLENERIKYPQELFNIPEGDKLALIDAATTGEQAKEEYFSRMSEALKHSDYFMDNFDVYDANRSQNSLRESRGRIDIQTTKIDFPHLIKAYPVNARNESFEGKNVIFFCMDEASGFISDKGRYNASKIYDTLSSSSREWPYVGLIFSFPRLDAKHDWTFLKLKESEHLDSVIGTQKKTWEVKPEIFYSGERFPFTFTTYDDKGERIEKTEMVPVEYEDYFKKNPSDAVAKYMGIPTAIVGRFLQDIEFALAPSDSYPIFEVNTEFKKMAGKEYIHKKIVKQNYSINTSSVVVIDQAETDCKCVVMIGHRETIFSDVANNSQTIICVDGIYLYDTDIKRGLVVDNDNFAMFLNDIVMQLRNVSVVRMDHWNSVRIKQLFEKQFIDVSVKGPRRECYDKARSLIMYGNFKLPNQPDMVREMESQFRALNNPTTNSKPTVIYGYQDIIDCFVQLVDELWVDNMLDQSNLGVGNVLSTGISNLSGTVARQHLEKERIERMNSFQQDIRKSHKVRKSVGRNLAVGRALSYGKGSRGHTPGVSCGIDPNSLQKKLKDLGG